MIFHTKVNRSSSLDLLTDEDKRYISLIAPTVSSELEAAFHLLFGFKDCQIISLYEFYDALVRHDWYYLYFDSWQERDSARNHRAKLDAIACRHIKFATLLEEFVSWARNNHTRSCPMPVRPTVNLVIKHNYVPSHEGIAVHCDESYQ